MISERKLAANRANALKSTGPRSDEGKCRVSRNAIKHGITAAGDSLKSSPDYQSLLAGLKKDLAPQDAAEDVIIERIAAISVRLRRLHITERMFYLAECANLREEDEAIPMEESVGMLLALETGDMTVQLMQRYDIALNRALHAAFRELRQMQSEKQELFLHRMMREPVRNEARATAPTRPTTTLPNKPTEKAKLLPELDLSGEAKPLSSPLDLLKSLEANPQMLLSGHLAKRGRGSPHL